MEFLEIINLNDALIELKVVMLKKNNYFLDL